MMPKVTGSLIALGAVLLVACSKQAAPTSPSEPGLATTPPSAATEQSAGQPQDLARKASGLLTLVADTPQCQSFRSELQAAGQSPGATGDQLNEIVAKAAAAGCGLAPGAH